MMKHKGLLSVFVLFVCAPMSVLAGTNRTVKLDGSGDFTTIKAAIEASASGDTVTVYPGTYTGAGNRDLIFGGKAITVQSTNPDDWSVVDATIIDVQGTSTGEHQAFIFDGAAESGSVIRGLTLTGGYYSHGGSISCANSCNPLITQCVFANNTSNTYGGAVYCFSSSPIIRSCVFANNKNPGRVEGELEIAGFGGAIYCDTNSNPQMDNCVFVSNTATNGGAVFLNSSGPAIRNCTFAKNKADNLGSGLVADVSSQVTIINTIFWFTASEAGLAQIALRTSSTATVSYCDYKTQAGTLDVDTDGTSSYTWTAGTNLLDVDPAFADMANDDLHLTSSSGCLDKGDPAGDYTGLTDIDGDSRVINGRVDIGADELAVPTPTPTPTPGSSDTGILTVATNPVAGEVFVNGTSWGTSPQSRTLAVGQYTVSFGPVDGYTTPGSQVVTLSKDQSLTVAGVYVPVVAETGTLEVTTTPVAGDVLVDGVSWGAAPQTRTVSVGPHLVRFGTVAGYDTPGDQIAIVVKDQTTSVLGTYIAPSAGMGTLTVDTEPVKAAVFVDGSYVGTAPVTGSLSAGSHTVSFGLVEGYIQPADQSVTIQKDQETRITGTYVALPADKGMLLVNTTPIFAKIFVDGVDWGTAPQWRKLGVGTHVVSFAEIAGLTKPADQTVEIEKNKSLIVTGTYQLPGLEITPTTIPVDGAGLGCPCGGAGVTLILALGFGALLLGSSRWEK